MNWAVAAFQQVGDAFLFYLLGHEYAHAVQARLGIQNQFTIQQELQADCMAGAYIGDSVRTAASSSTTATSTSSTSGLLAVGDDPDQPWFAAGRARHRRAAHRPFFNGYEKSLAACDLLTVISQSRRAVRRARSARWIDSATRREAP